MSRANEPTFARPGSQGVPIENYYYFAPQDGLTIREAFTKAAMQGLCANECWASRWNIKEVALWSIQQADATLAALDQPAAPAADTVRDELAAALELMLSRTDTIPQKVKGFDDLLDARETARAALARHKEVSLG